MKKRAAVLVLFALLTACEGPMGPAGEQGPQGEQGPAGVPHYFSATVDGNGEAVVQLPAAAGTLNQPPGLTCYLREPGGQFWFVVGLDTNIVGEDIFFGVSCLLLQEGTNLLAAIIAAPTGWQVLFTAIY